MPDGGDKRFSTLTRIFNGAFDQLQENDMPPTITLVQTAKAAQQTLQQQQVLWTKTKAMVDGK